ncbi:MAG: hypothetical protein ABIP80_04500 [Ferruginibacter sp.]
MIFVANIAFAQQDKNSTLSKTLPVLNLNIVSNSMYSFPKTVIPGNFYTCHLGFFCKQEIKFEALTKIPFKFRLGSVQEVDRLEGKRTSHY